MTSNAPAPPIVALVDVLPEHILVEVLSRLVEAVGLRTSVAAARSVSRLFRACTNAALAQALGSITSRALDNEGVRQLVHNVLYDRCGGIVPRSASPHFASLKSVTLTGCAGVDAHGTGLLLAHAPAVEVLHVEGTEIKPEETHALAHMTRTPIAAFRLGMWTPLHEAVSSARRFAEAVESGALAEGGALRGIYVDVCNERGLTPLLVASYNGVTEAAAWLLAHGACPDACDCYHVSALMKASYFGHADTVRELLAHGANSSRVDMYGAGALAKAAYRGHTAVVRLLLAAGARTDGEDLYGNRPLHSAVASGHRNIAMLLLQYGATDTTRGSTTARAHRRPSGGAGGGHGGANGDGSGAGTSGALTSRPPFEHPRGIPAAGAMLPAAALTGAHTPRSLPHVSVSPTLIALGS